MKLRLAGLFLLFIVCTIVIRHYWGSTIARKPQPMMTSLVAQDGVLRPAVPTAAEAGIMPPSAVPQEQRGRTDPSGRFVQQTLVRPVTVTQYREEVLPGGERRRVPVTVTRMEEVKRWVPLAAHASEEEAERERRLVQLAEMYRREQTADEKEEIRAEMDDLARELLDLQQERWSKKIEELAEQLEKLKSLQEERKQREDEIVDRRINQLLSEPDVLDWDPLRPQPGAGVTLAPGLPPDTEYSGRSTHTDPSGKEVPVDTFHVDRSRDHSMSVPTAPRSPTAPTFPNQNHFPGVPVPTAPRSPTAPTAPQTPQPEARPGAATTTPTAVEPEVRAKSPSPENYGRATFERRREFETRVKRSEEPIEPAIKEVEVELARDAVMAEQMPYATRDPAGRLGSAFDRLSSIKEAASDVLQSMRDARSSEQRLQHFERLRQKGLTTSSTVDAARSALQEAQREIEINTRVLDALEDQLQLEQKIVDSEMAALEEARSAAKTKFEAGQESRAAVAASEAALQRAQLQLQGLSAALNLLNKLEEQIEEARGTAATNPVAAEDQSDEPRAVENDAAAPSNDPAGTAQP